MRKAGFQKSLFPNYQFLSSVLQNQENWATSTVYANMSLCSNPFLRSLQFPLTYSAGEIRNQEYGYTIPKPVFQMRCYAWPAYGLPASLGGACTATPYVRTSTSNTGKRYTPAITTSLKYLIDDKSIYPHNDLSTNDTKSSKALFA